MAVYEYYVSVEDPGGADLSFRTLLGHPLVDNEIVNDDLGRSFVIIEAELLPDAADPEQTGRAFGKARARPAD